MCHRDGQKTPVGEEYGEFVGTDWVTRITKKECGGRRAGVRDGGDDVRPVGGWVWASDDGAVGELGDVGDGIDGAAVERAVPKGIAHGGVSLHGDGAGDVPGTNHGLGKGLRGGEI